jgi:tRNA U34 2-thiouridine synthase MnmA/TrmU
MKVDFETLQWAVTPGQPIVQFDGQVWLDGVIIVYC